MPTSPRWVTEAPAPVREILAATTFLPWFKIADMDNKRLPTATQLALRRSGTYVVASSTAHPADDPLVSDVRYIGMTKGQTSCLANRIRDFATAARGGEASHSGGRTWYGAKLGARFWISAAPSIDLRDSGWRTQSWCIWPEVVEKALLMAYAHRHGDFPDVNKEGWDLPEIKPKMIESVWRVLNAPDGQVIQAARGAVSLLAFALGYQAKKLYEDPGVHDPDWIGVETRLSKGYWLWIGRVQGQGCHVGIWHREGASAWYAATIRDPQEVGPELSNVLHAWHTAAGLL